MSRPVESQRDQFPHRVAMQHRGMAWDEWSDRIQKKGKGAPCGPGGCDHTDERETGYLIDDPDKGALGELNFSHRLKDNKPQVVIDWLWTHPSHRNDGMAEAMMRRLHQDHPHALINPGAMLSDGVRFHDHMLAKEPDAKKVMARTAADWSQPNHLNTPLYGPDERRQFYHPTEFTHRHEFSPTEFNPWAESIARPTVRWKPTAPEQDTLDLDLPSHFTTRPGLTQDGINELVNGKWQSLKNKGSSPDGVYPVDRQPIKLYRGVSLDLRHPAMQAVHRALWGPEYSYPSNFAEETENPGLFPQPDHTPDPRGFDNPELGQKILDHINDWHPDVGMGRHWSTSVGVAKDFSGHNYPVSQPALISAEWLGRGEDPYRTDAYGNFSGENEITMMPGAPLRVTQVHLRHPSTGKWHPVLGTGPQHREAASKKWDKELQGGCEGCNHNDEGGDCGEYFIEHGDPKELFSGDVSHSQVQFGHGIDNDGNPRIDIDFIETHPDFQHKGIGEAMIRRIQDTHPGVPIDFGDMTDDGLDFFHSLLDKGYNVTDASQAESQFGHYASRQAAFDDDEDEEDEDDGTYCASCGPDDPDWCESCEECASCNPDHQNHCATCGAGDADWCESCEECKSCDSHEEHCEKCGPGDSDWCESCDTCSACDPDHETHCPSCGPGDYDWCESCEQCKACEWHDEHCPYCGPGDEDWCENCSMCKACDGCECDPNAEPVHYDTPLYKNRERPLTNEYTERGERMRLFLPHEINPASAADSRPMVHFPENEDEDPVLLGDNLVYSNGIDRIPASTTGAELYRGLTINLKRHPELAPLRRAIYGDEKESYYRGDPVSANPAFDRKRVVQPGMFPGPYSDKELAAPPAHPDRLHQYLPDILHHLDNYVGYRGLGEHWSTRLDQADSFAGPGSMWNEKNGDLPVRLTGRWFGHGEDPYRPNTGEEQAGQFEEEREISLRPHAPIKLTDLEIYHPKTKQWHSLMDLPDPIQVHARRRR